MTVWHAARFALVPGKAERFYCQAKAHGSKEFQRLTKGILLSRYSAVLGVGLGVFSTLQTASAWPLAISASITLVSSAQLYRYTKLFMAHVDKKS